MNDTHAAIRALEQELEATQQRCHLIERTLEGLRQVYGITGAVLEEEEAPPARSKKTAGNGRAAAVDLDDEIVAFGERIVAALKKAGGTMRPGDLATAAKGKLEKYAYKSLLLKVEAAGLIVRKGTGRGAIVTLPAKSARGRL
jgi:hypothetical protein